MLDSHIRHVWNSFVCIEGKTSLYNILDLQAISNWITE